MKLACTVCGHQEVYDNPFETHWYWGDDIYCPCDGCHDGVMEETDEEDTTQ